jgi:endonuclease IV
MEYILNFIEEKVSLISKSVDPLIDKLKRIEEEGLERIIKN